MKGLGKMQSATTSKGDSFSRDKEEAGILNFQTRAKGTTMLEEGSLGKGNHGGCRTTKRGTKGDKKRSGMGRNKAMCIEKQNGG